MATAAWLDDALRAQLERKREELRGQLADLERVINGSSNGRPSVEARIVRAGRRPLSEEAKKAIGRRMKAVWRERKKKLGTD